ncbi:MAG: hypothetical protein U0670_14680 [Anaerolineae bacterium]
MPMKSRLLPLSLAAVAFVFLLSACSPPNLRDPQLLQDNSLTASGDCTAPCWRGITPGVTSWNDAYIRLQDDGTLENVTVQTDPNSPAKVAEFQQKGGTAGCCQMYSEDGQIVDLLFLRLAPSVSLGQLIEAHGEPTYALSTEYSGDQSIINLVYPDVPMVIYAFVPGATGALSATSEIIGVLYMTPTNMQLLIETSSMHAYTGYAAFSEYATDQPFEVTPEITLTPTPGPGTPTAVIPTREIVTEEPAAADSTDAAPVSADTTEEATLDATAEATVEATAAQ